MYQMCALQEDSDKAIGIQAEMCPQQVVIIITLIVALIYVCFYKN